MNFFLKMKKSNTSDLYSRIESNDNELDVLRIFLIEEVLDGEIDLFKKWAKGEILEELNGSQTYLEKDDKNIFIQSAWFEGEPNSPELQITIEDFVSVLNKWSELIKSLPEFIFIKKENGHIFLEAA